MGLWDLDFWIQRRRISLGGDFQVLLSQTYWVILIWKCKNFKGFKEGFKGFNMIFRFSDFDFQIQRHRICPGEIFQVLIPQTYWFILIQRCENWE